MYAAVWCVVNAASLEVVYIGLLVLVFLGLGYELFGCLGFSGALEV